MKKLILLVCITVALILVGSVVAQRNTVRPGSVPGREAAPKDIFLVEGEITSLSLGIAQGSPSIVINDQDTIVLGSYNYLSEAGFGVESGDVISAQVFESIVHDGLLVAVSISSPSGTIQIRDEFGQPLWKRSSGRRLAPRGGRMGGAACEGTGANIEASETWTDSAVSMNAGLGNRYPTIILASGRVLIVGPNRLWAETGFQVNEGEGITVTAFPSSGDPNVWVAMKVVNSSGDELILRDDTGLPSTGTGWESKRQGKGNKQGGQR